MLQEHLGYVGDKVRLELFQAAIRQIVRPGDCVADLGCGTGLLGLWCLRAGAAHVTFIEHGPILEVARQTMARAGFHDRASFISGRSQHVDLPSRVDVIVCDHVGCLGFDYGILPLLQDARQRFLVPAGRLIPSRFTLHVAAVESEACHAHVEGWAAEHVPRDFHWLRNIEVNTEQILQVTRHELISQPADLAAMDLAQDQPGFGSWMTELRMTRDGVVHGLAGWFDCELAPGIHMTNAPAAERPIDRPQAFLPIGEPVRVTAGDRVTATLMARPCDQMLAWTLVFQATGQRLTQSTLQGMLLSPEDLSSADPSRVPRLSREGLARLTVLGYCDGRRSARDIEQAVLRDHPEMFPSGSEISRFVARVLGLDTL